MAASAELLNSESFQQRHILRLSVRRSALDMSPYCIPKISIEEKHIPSKKIFCL